MWLCYDKFGDLIGKTDLYNIACDWMAGNPNGRIVWDALAIPSDQSE